MPLWDILGWPSLHLDSSKAKGHRGLESVCAGAWDTADNVVPLPGMGTLASGVDCTSC